MMPGMRPLLALLALAGTLLSLPARTHAQLPAEGNLSRTNLVAWCIVPFDSRKRGPEERAAMLERLGIRRLAYDWRAEHIPTFDAEVEAMRRRRIEITAWWFPAGLNDEARAILACIERQKIHPQLWITLGTEPEPNLDALTRKIAAAVESLKPVCTEARRLGCPVALYNHLGWFGEPTNQVRVIRALHDAGFPNVGSVYNFHHAHAHIDDFARHFQTLQPHLLALNLNGMLPDGDRTGRKIIPLGTGTEELEMLRIVHASGWKGPVGIIGHTDEDAEAKLRKELDGLQRLAPKASAPAALKSPAVAGLKPATPEPGARPAGTPSTSGREPGLQGEGDWVDNRWQAADIGRHLAATFRLHDNATVTRGLAIRLGKADQGAVLYDTATATLRAAWTGAFLQFDPARFGLIGAPRTAGSPAFRIGTHTQWPKARVEFAAVRVARDAVGLEWRVDDSTVTEVPSVQETPAGTVFLRHFTVAAHDHDLDFVLGAHLRGDTHAGSGEDRAPEPPRHLATASGPELATAALLVGVGSSYSGVNVGKDSTIETLRLPASRRDQHFTVALWAGPKSGLEAFQNWAQSLRVTRPPSLLAPPAPEPEIATAGQLDSGNDLFAVDTLTFPYDNPAKSLFFASGVDAAPDGTVYASAMHGDVWQLRGVDRSLRKLRWRRFATGLYQPLGLKVWKGDVYVLGRDRITRLVDHDRNGIAERQETWFGGIDTSAGGHDYVTCLEVDDQGRFYYVDPKGMHRIQRKDGLLVKETLGTGFRNPNGMGVSPDGRVLTAAPQQGTWTPSSGIWEVRPGLYGGYGGPKVTPDRPDGYDHPLCWIPHAVDNSSGSQVWIPRREWGVLGGRMLHLLWGRCGLMLVLRDTEPSGAGINGAVVPLPAKFLSGPNRASWNPRDDSLLVAGSTGWQTSAVKDGSLHRVRWKGGTPSVPIDWKVVRGGIEVEFAEPLDPATANDAGSWSIRAWNYRYAEAYGSKDWKPSEPQKEGRDAWDVSAAELLPGGRRVRLTVPSIAPVMQGELKYNVNTAKAARPLKGSLWFTVNRVP